MKQFFIVLSFFVGSINTIFAGFSNTSDKKPSRSDEIFLTSPLTPTNTSSITHLVESVSMYPTLGITTNGSLHQGIQDRANKSMTPAKTRPLLRDANLSILRTAPNAFKNYPKGANLFPGYSQLSTKFDVMIQSFQDYPKFIPFFRKVHINVLNELYHYLMAIYMNFNLQHAGIQQSKTGKIFVSIPEFEETEQQYAANAKTLIINHLIAIIESQFNGAIRSYARHMPQTFATFIGKAAIQNDYSVDLTHFIIHQIEPDLIKFKTTSLASFAKCLSFFQLFTSYLNQPHPKHPDHFTAFVDIAEKINQFLYAQSTADDNKDEVAFAKMNPPLFHLGYDDIRALKLIPHLAQSIPKNVASIDWPNHIVEAAQEGLIVNLPGQKPHPIAYFRTKNGEVTRNLKLDRTIPLFICMRLGENLFEQELIAQPDWLNSWEGVCKIIRACFGDFSALLGMNILDPCMEALISNIVLTQQGKNPNAEDNISAACKQLINQWKTFDLGSAQAKSLAESNAANLNIANAALSSDIPSLQTSSDLPTMTNPLILQP